MLAKEVLGARVSRANVPPDLPRQCFHAPLPWDQGWISADRHEALVRYVDLGSFYVVGGNRVAVNLDPGADLVDANAVLHALVAGLLLGQQGRTALHATAVGIGDAVVAVAGPSGIGKSTTAFELVHRGHRLLADDVCPIRPGSTEQPLLEPFGRPVHVWRKTLEALGMPVPPDHHVLPGSEKLVLPPPAANSVHLSAICFIEITPEPTVACERVSPSTAAALLDAQAASGWAVRRIWPEQIFRWAAALAEALVVYRISRPEQEWTVAEVADQVERIAARSTALTPVP